MKSYQLLRKYIKCFGTLQCSEDSQCSFVAECLTEALADPEKLFEKLKREGK